MTNLEDFPTEILEQINAHLDDTMLLCNAHVNRRLNSVALSELFRRHGVFRRENIAIYSLHEDTMTILRALCMAVWIKDIPSITFHVNSGVPDLFDEIYSLTIFIDQLEFLGSLDLHVGLGAWRETRPLTPQERVARGKHWREALFALLETALMRGSQKLFLCDGQPMKDYMEMGQDRSDGSLFQPTSRRSTLLLQQFRSWVTRKGRGIVQLVLGQGPDEEATNSADTTIRRWASDQSTIINARYSTTLPASRVPGLEKLFLSSPSLMSPLCFSKTLSTFRRFAHTIRILSISYETQDQHRWAAFLEQIQLPQLDSLYCHGAVVLFVAQPTITTETIISFVSRHPSLTHLEIRNIPPLFDRPERIPLLPNLRSLVSHATFATYLLQNPDNCRHLDSVFILSQAPKAPAPASYNFYLSMDSALSLIAGFTSSAIRLQLDFATVSDVSDWMNEHIRLDTASVLRKLTQVRHLKVWPVLSASRIPGGPLLEVLPRWLALFPSLEILYVGISGAQVFYDEVVGLCPRLKVFGAYCKHILPTPKEPGARPWY